MLRESSEKGRVELETRTSSGMGDMQRAWSYRVRIWNDRAVSAERYYKGIQQEKQVRWRKDHVPGAVSRNFLDVISAPSLLLQIQEAHLVEATTGESKLRLL